jgi:hypothetical protein
VHCSGLPRSEKKNRSEHGAPTGIRIIIILRLKNIDTDTYIKATVQSEKFADVIFLYFSWCETIRNRTALDLASIMSCIVHK